MPGTTRRARAPRGALPGQFIEELACLIRRLAADTPPRPVPSAQECSFCELTASDWSANQRERYANYLDDPRHLIAVTAAPTARTASRPIDENPPESTSRQNQPRWTQAPRASELATVKLNNAAAFIIALVTVLVCPAGVPQDEVRHQSNLLPAPDRSQILVIDREAPSGFTDPAAVSVYPQVTPT